MYRCFKVSLESSDFEKDSMMRTMDYKKYGEDLKKKLTDSFSEILNQAIDGNGVISGETFIDTWFPTENYDVFLSYSHDDEEMALLLAGFLKQQFNLKVFIDELFWGSADQLLRKLDDKFCKKDDGDYDYKKRNFTTTHVHAMLSTAIARTICNSEIVMFLNSEKSVYKIRDEVNKRRTLSPWIYEEIFLTSIIDTREWYEHRTELLHEGTEYFQKSLEISYLLPDEHLIPMQYQDLRLWNERWKKRKENGMGRYGYFMLQPSEQIRHPLNVLYDIKKKSIR